MLSALDAQLNVPWAVIISPANTYIHWKRVFIAVLSITVALEMRIPAEAQDTEFNTLLFQTTFKIAGPAEPRAVTLGTVFLMSRPIRESAKFRTVLITARH